MAKLAAAQARMFKNVFVCKDCSSKIRSDSLRVITGKTKCRKCGSHALRPRRRK